MTKTALITGGSRGIGKATADILRGKGWEVVAPGRDKFNAQHYTSALRYSDRLRAGDLGALVLCAGEWFSRPVKEQTIWDFEQQFSYLHTAWTLIREMLPSLEVNGGGSVVAVASTRAFIGGVDCAPYAVAKAGLVALMQGFAREYGGGVRFNCVCPGLTETDMAAQVRATGGAKPDAIAQPPEAVAAEIVRLIESDDNGRVMRVVDGKATEARWTW